MFGLFYGLWKLYLEQPSFSILILGLDNAGKTTCLEQLKLKFGSDSAKEAVRTKDLTKSNPTVGLNVGKLTLDKAKVLVWDLGGQEALRTLWDKYFEEAHGLIYVIDCADKERIKESHQELVKILNNKQLSGAPVLIFANKQDLDKSLSGQEIAKLLAFKSDLHSKRSFHIEQGCALNAVLQLIRQGLEDGLHWLLRAISRSDRLQDMEGK